MPNYSSSESDAEAERAQARKRKRVRGRFTDDGCLIPDKQPRMGFDGKYVRPKGRSPDDMKWDGRKGMWVPIGGPKKKAPPKAKSPAKRPPQQKTEKEEEGDDFHPHSRWQEPPTEDELTLYERHRTPRAVMTGRIQRPLKALQDEFRCVICLGCIRNARVVMECLHRFCDDCIEKSLRMGRNECPICRVYVPSRRSLAPDPKFDKLIHSILGEDLLEEEDGMVPSINPVTAGICQKAISDRRRNPSRHRGFEPKESIDDSDDCVESSDEEEDQDDGNELFQYPSAGPATSVVDIQLRLHPDARPPLEPLHRPFLRISGDATVQVLKSFLRQKLGRPHDDFRIVSFFLKDDLPIALKSDIKLKLLAHALFDRGYRDAIIVLHYRIEPEGDDLLGEPPVIGLDTEADEQAAKATGQADAARQLSYDGDSGPEDDDDDDDSDRATTMTDSSLPQRDDSGREEWQSRASSISHDVGNVASLSDTPRASGQFSILTQGIEWGRAEPRKEVTKWPSDIFNVIPKYQMVGIMTIYGPENLRKRRTEKEIAALGDYRLREHFKKSNPCFFHRFHQNRNGVWVPKLGRTREIASRQELRFCLSILKNRKRAANKQKTNEDAS